MSCGEVFSIRYNKFAFVFLVLRRYLFIQRGSAGFFGIIIGLGLSIVPFVVVQQIVDGMIQGIAGRYIETSSYHLRTYNYSSLNDAQQIIEKLESLEGVHYVGKELKAYGLLASEKVRSAVTIRAVPVDKWQKDVGFRSYYRIDAGNFLFDKPKSIIISSELARILQVNLGDWVRLATGTIDADFNILPRLGRYQVSGIVSNGYQELDRYWVYLPLEVGEKILPNADEFIGIKIAYPFSVPNRLLIRLLPTPRDRKEREGTAALIRSIRDILPHSWQLTDWYQLESVRYASFRSTRSMLLFLMCIIIIVAAMSITTALIRLVLEHSRDFAMLRCMGCRPRLIRKILIYCGVVIGLLSSLLGVGMGLLIAVNINEIIFSIEWLINTAIVFFEGGGEQGNSFALLNAEFYLEKIPVNPQFFDIFYIFVMVVGLATLSAYIPARKAGKMKPNEILFFS